MVQEELTVFEFCLILLIYKALQHFFYKSHVDFIFNAFIRSPSSQFVNTNDSLVDGTLLKN